MKNLVLLPFLLFFNTLVSQIHIEDVGDNWKNKIEQSLQTIKLNDSSKYDSLIKYCNHITFWNGDFSTTEDSNSIMISQKDMNFPLNNISCVIIHESYHLMSYKYGIDPDYEEYSAYKYELDFMNHLTYCEPWLKFHASKMMKYHLDRYKSKNLLQR